MHTRAQRGFVALPMILHLLQLAAPAILIGGALFAAKWFVESRAEARFNEKQLQAVVTGLNEAAKEARAEMERINRILAQRQQRENELRAQLSRERKAIEEVYRANEQAHTWRDTLIPPSVADELLRQDGGRRTGNKVP